MTKEIQSVNLVKTTYPCMPFPMIEFGKYCKNPCIYCGLKSVRAPEDKIITKGLENTINEINENYIGAYISPTADGFSQYTKDITYRLLEGILPYGKIPLIITKQQIPKKTIDLLVKYKNLPIVQVSIPTLDESLAKQYEPGSASIKERLRTMEKLAKSGISTIGLVIPWLGDIENSYELLSAIKNAGAKKCIASLGIFTEETKNKMKTSNNQQLIKIQKDFNTQSEILMGQGLTLPEERRIKLYKKLIGVGDKIDLNVIICKTALNPSLTKDKVKICDKFKHPLLKK